MKSKKQDDDDDDPERMESIGKDLRPIRFLEPKEDSFLYERDRDPRKKKVPNSTRQKK
jgi:hypothetical protein